MSSRKPPPLPPGWSQHESNKCPGKVKNLHFKLLTFTDIFKVYYFNKQTGATTWDIRDIVSKADLPSSGRQPDLSNISVEELERMLRRKKQEENLSPSKQKRKLSEENNSNHKRKRIVLNFSTEEDEKNKLKSKVNAQNAIEKDSCKSKDKSVPNRRMSCKSKVPTSKSADTSKDKKIEKSHDSEDSLVLDEDEIEELKKIKSKHKSPPKTNSLKKALPSPRSKISSNVDSSPKNVTSPKNPNVTEEITLSQNKLVAKPSSSSTSRFLPQNFSTRYVNYQNDEKLTYKSMLRDRKEKPVSVHKKSPPRPLNFAKEPEVDPANVTPDHDVDVTPVFGSFDSPELECGDEAMRFNLKQSIHQQQRQAYVPPPPIRPYEPPSQTEYINDSPEKSFNDISYEGERPPTPTLVKELEEEEGMEWEPSDVEQIIKETAMVRNMVSKECETEHHEASEQQCCEIPASKCLVIVDTNILISSLNTIVKLMDYDQVVVVIPWMVVQELDSLKNSDNQKTAVGARGGVRWLNSSLLSSSTKVRTQTLAQSRKVSAKFGSTSPDDKILATCFQYKEDGHKVVLVTNDVNLGNKALINQLAYRDSRNILELKEGELVLTEQRSDDEDSNRDVVSTVVTLVLDYLRDLLEGVLLEEFRSTFGEMWEKIVIIKPRTSKPYWTLNQLFTLYSKHHMAVFGLNFPRSGRDLKDNLTYLKTLISRRHHMSTTEAKILYSEIKKLSDCFKAKCDYDGLVSNCEEKMFEAMSQLKQQSSRKQMASTVDISNNSGRVQDQVQSLFQTIWEIVVAFTRGFTMIYQVECDPPIPLVEPDIQFHTLEQATRELPSFFRSVSGLHEAMLRAVSVGDEVSISQFHVLLLGFRAGLDLDQSYWAVQDSTITRRQLSSFMTSPENREIVTNGLDQLSGFRRNLIKCLERPMTICDI